MTSPPPSEGHYCTIDRAAINEEVKSMIQLYGMESPNVTKVLIMLEEIGRPYQYHYVAVMRGEGREPEFLALNPLGRVPVIVDSEGVGADCPLFESGAILTYLAETYQPALLPAAGRARWDALKWLTAQVAWAGPLLGQYNHFIIVPDEEHSYAGKRYRNQARRIYEVFSERLESNQWLAGDFYSVADIAFYPWSEYVPRHRFEWEDFPALAAWRERIRARPAVVRAMNVQMEQSQANTTRATDVTAADIDRFLQREPGGPPFDFRALYAKDEPGSLFRKD